MLNSLNGKKKIMNHTKGYKERNSSIDIADIKCEELLESKEGVRYIRYGFDQQNNRIPSKDFYLMPPTIRSQPDFIVFGKEVVFLEVKGCRDVLRGKKCDINAYEFWDNLMPLYFFIYSVYYREHKIITCSNLIKFTTISPIHIYEDNNKEYFKIDWETLE